MTGKRIRRISLYATIFFLAVAILNLYKGSYNEFGGSEDIQNYDLTNSDGGLQFIDPTAYVFEREYNLEGEEEKVDTAPEPLKDLEKEKKVLVEKAPEPKKKLKVLASGKYVVKKGDTLERIAKKNGIKVKTILDNNPDIKRKLKIGQELNLPSKDGIYYVVKDGETLSSIAKKYNVSVKSIMAVNSLKKKRVKLNQKIFIENPDFEVAKVVEIKRLEKESKKLAKKSRREKLAEKIFEEEKEEIRDSGVAFKWPCRWKGVSSPYGSRKHPVLRRYIFHEGVDLQGKTGDEVWAAKDGVVTHAGWMSGYGKLIIIDHGNGYTTRYGHLSSINVSVGASVSSGDLIGEVGSTGRSTGPHLHFEIRKNGRTVDPMKYR